MGRMLALVILAGLAVGLSLPDGRGDAAPGAAEAPRVHIVEPPAASRSTAVSSFHEVSLERQDDGHFYTDVRVNGMTINFLVDTGASGIALTREDAQRAGVLVGYGPGDVIGQGASGDVRGHVVTLDRVELGGATSENHRAAVLDGAGKSLLGQDFLSRFQSVEIRDDRMRLR